MDREFTCSVCGRHWIEADPTPGETNRVCPSCAASSAESTSADWDKSAAMADANVTADHTPQPEQLTDPRNDPSLPSIDGYEVLHLLGRGGMGVVYKARDQKLNRFAAIKMISAEHATPEQIRRFLTEAEAIAVLKHPNIVQIYEIGAQDERPFFALEYVDGGNLADLLKRQTLSHRESAVLVETLALGIFAAHQQGVIHRDLKPANVLMEAKNETESTDNGEGGETPNDAFVPKITDFGLAKRLSGDAGQTRTGAVVGTPRYMSPEQARGGGTPVDVRTDVYSLGVMFYEMLSGQPPFSADSPTEMLLKVVSEEAPPLRQLNRDVPRDLETICAKCLEKKPEHRYATAQALADELRRFLDNRPIQTRHVSHVERMWKWARRQPAWAALIGVSVLALVVFVVGTVWANATLQTALSEVSKSRGELKDALTRANESEDDAKKKAALYLDMFTKTRHNRYSLQLLNVSFFWNTRPVHAVQLLDDLQRCPDELRCFLWRYNRHRSECLTGTLPSAGGMQYDVAYSPDGSTIAATGARGGVLFFDVAKRKHTATLPKEKSEIRSLAYSPNGNYFATGDADGEIRLFDAKTLKLIRRWSAHKRYTIDLAFSPDGTQLASGGMDGKANIWNVPDGQFRRLLPAGVFGTTPVAFFPDGRRVVTGGSQKSVIIWDTVENRRIATLRGHKNIVCAVAVSKDGRFILSTEKSQLVNVVGRALVWDVKEKRVKWSLEHPISSLQTGMFLNDGITAVTGSASGDVSFWDIRNGKKYLDLETRRRVAGIAQSPDARRLTVLPEQGNPTIWKLPEEDRAVQLTSSSRNAKATSLAFLPGNRLVVGYAQFSPFGGRVHLWNYEKQQESVILGNQKGWVYGVAASRDGKRVAVDDGKGRVAIWDGEMSKKIFTLKHAKGVIKLFFTPDHNNLITICRDDVVRLWDLDAKTAKELFKIGKSAFGGSLSYNGRYFCGCGGVGKNPGEIVLWDMKKNALIRRWRAHKMLVRSVAVSPRGDRIATVSGDHFVMLWDAKDGKLIAKMDDHHEVVHSVAFSPDGRLLASGGMDKTIRFWDPLTGQERGAFTSPTDTILDLRFSKDAKTLAATNGQSVFVWRVK